MVTSWIKAIAFSTILTVTTTSLAAAHTSWLEPLSRSSQHGSDVGCGAQAIPYLAKSLDQSQIFGLRCLQSSESQIESQQVSKFTWYGASQSQGDRFCNFGTAMSNAKTLPTLLFGQAIDFDQDEAELTAPMEPLSVQAVSGNWPAPMKIQIQGNRDEIWIRIRNSNTLKPLVTQLRACDRYLNTPNYMAPRDHFDGSWLIRKGSGWDWLLRKR
jgi:hypothetical protein